MKDLSKSWGMRIPKNPSTRIEKAAYDGDKQVLTITFKSGADYEYYDLPEDVAIGLVEAESAGRYFEKNIKGIYNYRRVI